MIADLASHRLSVQAATGGVHTALVAKSVSATVQIVFTNGSEPVKFGLVPSLVG